MNVPAGDTRMAAKTLTVKVLNPKHVLFEGEARSVFLPGDLAEFEIMPYHAPIVSLLKAGEVVIDWTVHIPIIRGMVKYYHNECMVLVEEERRGPVEPAAKPS